MKIKNLMVLTLLCFSSFLAASEIEEAIVYGDIDKVKELLKKDPTLIEDEAALELIELLEKKDIAELFEEKKAAKEATSTSINQLGHGLAIVANKKI